MEKITWRKLLGWGLFILPNIIAASIPCCVGDAPSAGGLLPALGSQGTDISVTIFGNHFRACAGAPSGTYLYIDGTIAGSPNDVSVASVSATSDTAITFTMHIDPNARLGAHPVVVSDVEGASDPLYFTVTCPGCPPAPQLLSIVAAPNSPPLVPGGQPVVFQIIGTDFLNNDPQVQIDGPGISFLPGPYSVLGGGGIDYFFVTVTADATAPPGPHHAHVITTGGTSNVDDEVVVDASQPLPNGSPANAPFLKNIIPSHIKRFSGTIAVSIKFEGIGFGVNHEILVDQNNTIQDFSVVPLNQADPDKVAVGIPDMNLPTGPDSSVTVRVHNLDNDKMSNPLILFLDELDPAAPLVETAYTLTDLQQGGDTQLYISGQNLQNFTVQNYQTSLAGVANLTFSNFVRYSDGIYQVTVHAAANAPLSGDEATNLTVTTTDGQSNPFWIRVWPPFPHP